MTDLLAPPDEAGIAAAVAEASAAREPLLVFGNGTKAGMLRPVQAARSLSTRNHTGITLYSPNELVISARAGTPLAEIEATLAEHGQHIIAEPPDLSSLFGVARPQTLGGVIATNLSGPRRVAWGAMRDHLLGIRAVTGRGEVIRSGGRVLKNVTGLDLCKLLAGSHGTLGVITEVTLKVLPAPEAVGTVVLPGLDAVVRRGGAVCRARLAVRCVRRGVAAVRSRCPSTGTRRAWPFRRPGTHRGLRIVGHLSDRKAARDPGPCRDRKYSTTRRRVRYGAPSATSNHWPQPTAMRSGACRCGRRPVPPC